MTGIPLQKGMPLRQLRTVEQQDAKLREAAGMYEKHFLRELVKNMRATVPEGGGLVKTSQAEKIFREQLDEKYVDQWGDRGGVGLADMIYKQMVERFGTQLGIKPPTERLHGPVALGAQSRESGSLPSASSSVGFRASTDAMRKSVRLLLQDMDGQTNPVVSPWSGVLNRTEETSDGKTLLGIDHQNGFQSELRFSGHKVPQLVHGRVVAGEPLGTWTSGNSDLEWKVDFRPAAQGE